MQIRYKVNEICFIRRDLIQNVTTFYDFNQVKVTHVNQGARHAMEAHVPAVQMATSCLTRIVYSVPTMGARRVQTTLVVTHATMDTL